MAFDVHFAHFPEGFPARCELPRTAKDEDGETLYVAPRIALMRLTGMDLQEIGSLIGTTANDGGRIPAHRYGSVVEYEGRWRVLQVNF